MSSDAKGYEAWSASMGAMKQAAPDVPRAFGGMFQALMKDGALTAREKELIALGIGVALRCDHCIWSHMEKCMVKQGVTREQALEAAGVAVLMGGGPVYTHMPTAVAAADYFEAKAAPARVGAATNG